MSSSPDPPHDALYTPPVRDLSVADCHFYHTMDVPGHGLVTGEWDLRGRLDDYLGHFDFCGRRVLDVGAASGILSFHAEKNGGEVVSFDLSEDHDWDLVPFVGVDFESRRHERRAHLRRINNGYWFCHQAHGSSARMVNGVVYAIPDAIGAVDVVLYGSILIHLRDPFLALQNGAKLAKEAIIVADISPWGPLLSRYRRSPRFLPQADRPAGITEAWYKLPPRLVQEYLAILGFTRSRLTWNHYAYGDRSKQLYTIVARR